MSAPLISQVATGLNGKLEGLGRACQSEKQNFCGKMRFIIHLQHKDTAIHRVNRLSQSLAADSTEDGTKMQMTKVSLASCSRSSVFLSFFIF